jgi:hypothetical protein
MGLDMFLMKETYIGANYDHNNITGTVEIYRKGELIPIKLDRISTISEEVAYWRKAWVIHTWFVDNVQNGEDDCGTYRVKYDQLVTLVNICKRILNEVEETGSRELAEELLPIDKGNECCGGVSLYGEDYFEELRLTVKMIDPVLAKVDPKDYSVTFEYRSSW